MIIRRLITILILLLLTGAVPAVAGVCLLIEESIESAAMEDMPCCRGESHSCVTMPAEQAVESQAPCEEICPCELKGLPVEAVILNAGLSVPRPQTFIHQTHRPYQGPVSLSDPSGSPDRDLRKTRHSPVTPGCLRI